MSSTFGLRWAKPNPWRGKLHAYPPRKRGEKFPPPALCGMYVGAFGHNFAGTKNDRADPMAQCRTCARIALGHSEGVLLR